MNLWCPDDVSRILAATEDSLSSFRSAIPSLDPETANAYHLGFLHALQAISVAFGLSQPASRQRRQPRPAPRRPTRSWGIIDHQFLDPQPANGQRTESRRQTLPPGGLER